MKLLHMHAQPSDFGSFHMVKISYEVPESLIYAIPAPMSPHKCVIAFLRNNIQGTWGFTNDHRTSLGQWTAYIFFTDEDDYLYFKLKTKHQINTVLIWPSLFRFSIYEYVAENDTKQLPQ